jgi:aldose 1-epimerase
VRQEPSSGRQFELRRGRQRAVVVEVGGGLREYEVNGQPVLDGYPLHHMADGGRGQPLLPWPNRLADGRYEFGGQTHQLPIDEVERGNALHGLTRWLGWNLAEQALDRARLELILHPRPGYPFALRLSIVYSLTDAGLNVRTTARNIGGDRLPFGAGFHPYFTVGTPFVDSATLRISARSSLELDAERRLPTGRLQPVAGSENDFREARPIGASVLDACLTDLHREPDGRAQVVLADPGSGKAVAVWMEERFRYVQIFSGDTLLPERRRRGLAIEPMTCPPDAFRTRTDLIVLEPDEAVSLEWGILPTGL